MRIAGLSAVLFFLLIALNASAYFNATYLNTTVILNSSTSAHVVETVLIFVSNSSVNQYIQDRGAINLSLSDWQRELGTQLLVQHIFKSSISNFTLLPGPLVDTNPLGGKAYITMSYTAYNIITVSNIGPRKFEYSMNGGAFNFQHAASGQVLPPNARFNIIIPKGAGVVSIYPLPDKPTQNFLGNYTNVTTFSWFGGEPLSSFAFSYILTQSLREEVLNYFTQFYRSYSLFIYLGLMIITVVAMAYIYMKVFR